MAGGLKRAGQVRFDVVAPNSQASGDVGVCLLGAGVSMVRQGGGWEPPEDEIEVYRVY